MFFTLNDLLIAFKKAKSEVFHEKLQVSLMDFPQYEQNLEANLNKLLTTLNSKDTDFITSEDFNNKVGFYPIIKKINFKEKITTGETNVFYSKIETRWDKRSWIDNIEFRMISNLCVEFHIISSLWIDHVAYEYEIKLSPNSYGSRLTSRSEQHIGSTNHFKTYIHDYRKWQKNGLDVIREKLEHVDELVALTADIKSFYHHVNVNFLASKNYPSIFKGAEALSPKQIYLNDLLIKGISYWSEETYSNLSDATRNTFNTQGHVGIPIGLSASKVIANLLLNEFDEGIEQELMPLYYGRYVDDIFIVMSKNPKLNDRNTLWSFIAERLKKLTIEKDNVSYRYKISYASKSQILFNKDKERIFFLDKKCGLSIVNEIENELNENSSEWRFLPDAENELDKFTDEIIHTSSDSTETVNSLRKSDGISIQRLKYALFVRSAEELVLTHPSYFWKKGLNELFRVTANFVTDPDILHNYLQYMVRILRLAVYNSDFENFALLHKALKKSTDFRNTEFITFQDEEIDKYKEYISKTIELALYTGGSLIANKKKVTFFDDKVEELTQVQTNRDKILRFFITDIHLIPLKIIFDKSQIRFSDLLKKIMAKNEFKSFLLDFKDKGNLISHPLISDKIVDLHKIFQEFIYTPPQESIISTSFFLSIRKMTYIEITRYLDKWLFEQNAFFKAFLKLYDLSDLTIPIIEDGDYKYLLANGHKPKQSPVVAITSYQIEDESWGAHVLGTLEPDHSRLPRLYKLINNILENKQSKIDYIVLPELALPAYAINMISRKIKGSGITLIAGAEYNIDRVAKTVQNQVAIVIPITIGIRSYQVKIVQEKLIPAVHEARELYDKAHLKLIPLNKAKYIITKNGFTFSSLICNDFLNIDNRQKLRGKIDALFLVEWNKDIETYNSLVESAANDLHCYIVQVNNRLYGDTRIRAPYKEAHQRDLARIRGGLLDYFVISSLDIKSLRAFQMNEVSPPKPFKPVPTGFEMDTKRKLK